MTKFSFEVPIKHLDDFDEDQDFIFSLSILYTSTEYKLYIRDVLRKGLKTLWLDNSWNETGEADDLSHLTRLAYNYNVQRVIAPDDPTWSIKDIERSYFSTVGDMGVSRTIVVVSSPQMYIALKLSGAQHFAVAYRTRPGWDTEHLLTVENVHFLGLNDVPELLECKPLSCDTSMPIKLAITGRTLRQWQAEGYPHIHTKDLGHHGQDFFQAEMTTKEIDLAKENICMLKNAVAQKGTSS